MKRIGAVTMGLAVVVAYGAGASAGRRASRSGVERRAATRSRAKPGTFEALLDRARAVENLEPILSPFLQVCGKGSSLAAVQCRAIRRRMQRRVRDEIFVYDAPAVQVGAYNGTKLNYPIHVLGCLTCQAPLQLKWGLYGGHDRWYVTVMEPSRFAVKGGKVTWKGIELTDHLARGQKAVTMPVGPSETDRWEKTVRPNLRVQFVVSVRGKRWSRKLKADGLVVQLKGYRLYNQCNGAILASVPPSAGKGPVRDNLTCKGPVAPVVVAQTNRKITPQTLGAEIIRKVMKAAGPAIQECYDTYQIPGLARIKVVVKNDGTVSLAKVLGKFSGTPTGKCILDKVQNLIFPRFKQSTVRFTYPYYLR